MLRYKFLFLFISVISISLTYCQDSKKQLYTLNDRKILTTLSINDIKNYIVKNEIKSILNLRYVTIKSELKFPLSEFDFIRKTDTNYVSTGIFKTHQKVCNKTKVVIETSKKINKDYNDSLQYGHEYLFIIKSMKILLDTVCINIPKTLISDIIFDFPFLVFGSDVEYNGYKVRVYVSKDNKRLYICILNYPSEEKKYRIIWLINEYKEVYRYVFNK